MIFTLNAVFTVMIVSLTTAEIDYEVGITESDLQWLGTLLVLPLEGEVRIRKEYRQMADEEREQFHNAVNLLKEDKNVTLNKFDLLGNVHARWSTAAAAHNGPGFLGWHRVFLLMMENALRQKSENVTIPYWDTTLDDGMSKPYYSVIWSEQFMGTGGGVVKKGPFKNWVTPHGLGKLKRMIYAQGKLMNLKDIKRIMKQRHLNDISFPNADLKNNIEEIHNRAHQWVGGQMRKIEHSAYDPMFYVLHSFVDLLWEDFRNLQKQDGVDPNLDYPKDYGIASHSPLAPMGLGKLVVMDGLSDIWLQGIQYSPRPQCNATHPDCGSKYLKCNVKRSRCISYTYQEYEQKEKSEQQKPEKSKQQKPEKSEQRKPKKSKNEKSEKSKKQKQRNNTKKQLTKVLNALKQKEIKVRNSSTPGKSGVNDIMQNDASIEGFMDTMIDNESFVTSTISNVQDSPPSEGNHSHQNEHSVHKDKVQHNNSEQQINHVEHEHSHNVHKDNQSELQQNNSTHEHNHIHGVHEHNHSEHEQIVHQNVIHEQNNSVHEHNHGEHEHGRHEHIHGVHKQNHSEHDQRLHQNFVHEENKSGHNHGVHEHNRGVHEHSHSGHGQTIHQNVVHEKNNSVHEHNDGAHGHMHGEHEHFHGEHEHSVHKNNQSEHKDNESAQGQIHSELEHNHGEHAQSVSMETTTKLPSIFEQFGLRWWLFKREEENYDYQLNPINFWYVVTRLKSKSPMSNLLNTFKKPKNERTVDSKSRLKVLKPVINKDRTIHNVHTKTECLHSSAVTMATQSLSFVIFASLLIFYSW